MSHMDQSHASKSVAKLLLAPMGALAPGSPHPRPSAQAMLNNKINLMDKLPPLYYSVLSYTG